MLWFKILNNSLQHSYTSLGHKLQEKLRTMKIKLMCEEINVEEIRRNIFFFFQVDKFWRQKNRENDFSHWKIFKDIFRSYHFPQLLRP